MTNNVSIFENTMFILTDWTKYWRKKSNGPTTAAPTRVRPMQATPAETLSLREVLADFVKTKACVHAADDDVYIRFLVRAQRD